jgi:hypothetical protein
VLKNTTNIFKGTDLKNLLKLCSVIETTTGLSAIVIPSIVIQLLFATDVNGITIIISRLAGICLISLGIACWPGEYFSQALRAMFIYNILVAIFFVYIGLSSTLVGILLWPAAILHLGIDILLIRGLLRSKIKSN